MTYRKNNINKSLKLAIWASDFQINRLRLTNHWYVDGTFTITPCNFYQLVTIAIKDPNTGFVKPAMWSILDSKDEEAYYHTLRITKEIVSQCNTLSWTLPSVTLDFEQALINAFQRVFPETRIIGCLFHFKQALYREAQSQGLTKAEVKEETNTLVSRLGSLSWKGSSILVQKELEELEKHYEDSEHFKLISYYKNCWFDRLESGAIDYSNVEDEFRANSVLEQYNCHVKDCLPRCSSWPKFLQFLVEEEADYVNESFLAEQKGQVQSKSVNFGKVYQPKAFKVIKKTRNDRLVTSEKAQPKIVQNNRKRNDETSSIQKDPLKQFKLNDSQNSKKQEVNAQKYTYHKTKNKTMNI